MKRKVFGIFLVVILLLQTFHCGVVFASGDSILLDLETIVNKGTVHRGQMEYGQFDSQNVIIIKPGYSNRQSGTTVVLDYVIPEYIDASEYQYAMVEYYKTDNGTSVKFRPSLDGKMTNVLADAASDVWHRVSWKIAPESGESKRFNQFHFMPFNAQDANALAEERCYVKSISVHKNDPTTPEDVALNEKIKEDRKKANDALRGIVEDVSVFEDFDKMDKTQELIVDPSFENESDAWQAVSGSTLSFVSGGANDGEKYVKISNRESNASCVSQDVKDILLKNGPGDYRVFAFIKNDADSQSKYKDYKLSLVINGNEYTYSSFHITENWQKINGSFRIGWTGELSNASLRVCGVDKEDTADFYVDNVSMKKCLYNEEEASHNAYIKGMADGSFSPQGNITRAETCAIVSRLMADEASFKDAYTSNYPDINKSDWYYDNVAYLESVGALSYFENSFNPNTPITRAEFVYLVKNISILPEEKEVSFADVNESHPLYNDIVKAARSGLIAGYEDGTFRPDASITRAEAVTMVNRATKRYPVNVSYYGAKTSKFNDIDESHWAYNQVIEASTSHTSTVFDKGDTYVEAWKITNDNYDKELAKKTEDEANKKAEALKDEILNTKDNLVITGTKYYVSNNGDDNNSGLSPEEAWKTIDKVNSMQYNNGDAVLFERGGLWRGATVLCKSGVTYAAYGEGEKPKLYGSAKNYADASLWIETETPNVWTTTESFSNVGFLQFDYDKMSQKVFSKDELNKNLNFMQEKYNGVPILLYYDKGNPGSAFKNIEIAPEYSIFIADNKHDIRIDNICMKYTGWHGVKFANVENISVTNCEVGWIGGTGGSPTSSKTRWGNGIEFWESCKNILVDHCYVYQIYDAALTNQWKGESDKIVVEENVTYTNNLIEYATYSYEFFMNQSNSNSAIMKNITFANNISRYSGFGWGQDNRPNKETAADIKGWHSINRTENFVVKDNIFIGANLLNVDFSSYSRNVVMNTVASKNKFPQYLIKLDSNTYINNAGRKYIAYNQFNYNSGLNSNYDFVKDKIEYGAKLIITDTKFGPWKKGTDMPSGTTVAPVPTAPTVPVSSKTDEGENILANSNCDDTNVWKKNIGAKGKITVETVGDNKYLSLSDRVGSYEGIEQTGIADKLNKYGVGKYQVTGKIKVDGTSGTTCEVYVIAGSYKGQYEKYNLYSKINNITSEWQDFSITLDSSKLEFTTWPSDTVFSIREHSGAFDASTKLCIDDIKLVPVDTKPASSTVATTPSTPSSSVKQGEPSNASKDEVTKNILSNGTMDTEGVWALAEKTPKVVKISYEKESDGNNFLKVSGRTADWIGLEQTGFASKLKTGKNYILRMRVKIENAVNSDADLQFYMLSKTNADFKVYKKFTGIGDSWKNIEFEFTLDSAPSDARVNMRGITANIDGGNPANYNVCFDDIVIVEK
ncbi:MAG: hypothetical protein E7404_06120 [Ruminococcaceae bacterium]|nr:hypothetical protein [Oscillospiraceae bacterium]